MPIGGQLVLKGGITLKGVDKKKKKKKTVVDGGLLEQTEQDQGQAAEGDEQPGTSAKASKKVDPAAVNVLSGKAYEQEFEFENKRRAEGKTRSTPWGSTYRAPPTILHGYDKKVTGVTPQERLDLRCASKADKFCK